MARRKIYDQPRTQYQIRLSEDVMEDLRSEASARHVSRNYIIETAIKEWLKRNGGKAK